MKAPHSAAVRDFAVALREARIRADLNQVELAVKLGLSQSYLSRVENGIINPTLAVCEKLARGVGCTYHSVLRPDADQKK